MILEDINRRSVMLKAFKESLTGKGYSFKQLCYIHSQLELLDNLIKAESFNVLQEIVRKTNYRLLKQIDKGGSHVIDIYKNPDRWILCTIEENREEWLSQDSLIFSTERQTLVFTKNQKCNGAKYINNKWQ